MFCRSWGWHSRLVYIYFRNILIWKAFQAKITKPSLYKFTVNSSNTVAVSFMNTTACKICLLCTSSYLRNSASCFYFPSFLECIKKLLKYWKLKIVKVGSWKLHWCPSVISLCVSLGVCMHDVTSSVCLSVSFYVVVALEQDSDHQGKKTFFSVFLSAFIVGTAVVASVVARL